MIGPNAVLLFLLATMATPTERDPLIKRSAADADAEHAQPDGKRGLGPLELSARSRRGILAGVWMACFLAVRPFVQRTWLLFLL